MMTLADEDREMQLRRLVDAQENFTRTWAPSTMRERAQFTRDLSYLVHLIYREAQAPAVNRLAELAMRLPFPPTVITP